ncbi:hypothetical protein Bbelb_249620 [Branchiostoma belcheri]|nr:hypothetical protein Bbelb_249620 [Branchiostoma belcheri]
MKLRLQLKKTKFWHVSRMPVSLEAEDTSVFIQVVITGWRWMIAECWDQATPGRGQAPPVSQYRRFMRWIQSLMSKSSRSTGLLSHLGRSARTRYDLWRSASLMLHRDANPALHAPDHPR